VTETVVKNSADSFPGPVINRRNPPHRSDFNILVSGTCLADPTGNNNPEAIVNIDSKNNSKVISIDRSVLRAAKCEKCGAKMYPLSMLESHLSRHRRRQRWFNAEVRKLRYTFAHMRDIA
jgi:hypothetical protein